MIEIRRKAGVWTYEGGERVEMPQDVLCVSDADTLAGADFRGRLLSPADLSNQDLKGADLSGLVLNSTDFGGADLRGARLCQAELWNSDFRGALLDGADFTGADFLVTRLEGVDLRGAILSGARHLNRCRYDDDTIWPEGMEQPYAPDHAVRNVGKMMAAGWSPEE